MPSLSPNPRIRVLALTFVGVSRALVQLSSVVDVPEVVGGPACCVFDSPFLAIRANASTTLSYTANSETYLWSDGADVNAVLPAPAPTGLAPDPAPSVHAALSHLPQCE